MEKYWHLRTFKFFSQATQVGKVITYIRIENRLGRGHII